MRARKRFPRRTREQAQEDGMRDSWRAWQLWPGDREDNPSEPVGPHPDDTEDPFAEEGEQEHGGD